ncbi:MAG: hypothetical protein U9N42_01010 [Campylobacterota bacterium]|nr:hypothetical protein [Campylobacterota bacterium]
MKNSIYIFILLFFVSCGYQPTAHVAKSVLGEKVSTDVVVSLTDPENTVIMKDALSRAVITNFRASLVDKEVADSHLLISLKDVLYTPLRYDKQGFIVTYRVTVFVDILRNSVRGKNIGIKNYSAKGYYDFSIEPNAVVTDKLRYDAIKEGATKALQSYVAQVSSEGI